MIINKLLKMAVLKCNDKEFINLLKLTPSKTERFIRNKQIDLLPVNIFGKVEKESIAVYDMFVAKVMPKECENLLRGITPYLSKDHPLVVQITKLMNSNKYEDLFEILTHPDRYLNNITNITQVSKHFTEFYNNILVSIDVKYLKALAACILDHM